jgi:hypothetical protein
VKIKKSELKKLIKEEIEAVMDEGFFSGIGDKMGMQTQDTKLRALRMSQAYEKIANEYDIPMPGADNMPNSEMIDAAEHAADRAYEPAEEKAALLKNLQRILQKAGAGKYTDELIKNKQFATPGDATMPPQDDDIMKRLQAQSSRIYALYGAFEEVEGKKAAASAQYAKEQAKASIEKGPEYKAILKAKNDVRGYRTSDPLTMFSAEDLEKVLRQAGTSKQFIQALVKAGYIEADKLQSSYDIRLRERKRKNVRRKRR